MIIGNPFLSNVKSYPAEKGMSRDFYMNILGLRYFDSERCWLRTLAYSKLYKFGVLSSG